MKLHRDSLKWILKLGFGFILIYYVLRSKMIDFHLVQSLLSNPRNLFCFLHFKPGPWFA